jgi:hypothetical protein
MYSLTPSVSTAQVSRVYSLNLVPPLLPMGPSADPSPRDSPVLIQTMVLAGLTHRVAVSSEKHPTVEGISWIISHDTIPHDLLTPCYLQIPWSCVNSQHQDLWWLYMGICPPPGALRVLGSFKPLPYMCVLHSDQILVVSLI